jgi:hypothetical protein
LAGLRTVLANSLFSTATPGLKEEAASKVRARIIEILFVPITQY